VLTDNLSALCRWMVAGSEVARPIKEFQDQNQHRRWQTAEVIMIRRQVYRPHFLKDVRSLVDIIEGMGNPFEEESHDVFKLDTKKMVHPSAVETVMNVKRIGQEQFEAFTRECLLDRTKAVYDPIRRNKLKVFSTSTPRCQSKGQQQVASIKNDCEVFVRLSISCHIRVMETLRSSFVTRIRHVLPHCLMVEVSALVPRINQSINHEFLEWSEYLKHC